MSAWTGRWWRLHVGKNYVWARIAQLPAADASTCRQCLVHLIHEGGILIVLGTNFPTMFLHANRKFAEYSLMNTRLECTCPKSLFQREIHKHICLISNLQRWVLTKLKVFSSLLEGLKQIPWHTHVQYLEEYQMSNLYIDFHAS